MGEAVFYQRRGRAILSALMSALALSLPAALGPWIAPASAAEAVEVGGRFNSPIYVTAPASSPRRLFVVERGGAIRVLVDDESRAEPFLEIPGGVSTDGEGGLLSMAFPPDYPTNRRFYVFYSTPRHNRPRGGDIRIDEFKRSKSNRNRALPGSQRRVLRIEHTDNATHYGGQLQFDPDGLLYISTGDGGGAFDPEGDAQSPSSLLGKVLRIDPRADGDSPYRIPPSNPLVGRPGRDEILASGLRNPYRFSFDRATGDLWIGDVGQSFAEEVDFLPSGAPGANFGWNCYEGFSRTDSDEVPPCDPPFYVPPVHEYRHADHDADCHAITGGYVARNPALPRLFGRYIYGDYCGGQVWALRRTPGGSFENRQVGSVAEFQLVSFGEDARGRLHLVLTPGGEGSGRIVRIER